MIVCVPTRGTICHETFLALTNNLKDVKHIVATIARKPVVEARNLLAELALTLPSKNPFDFTPSEWFVLWADADAFWQPKTVSTMLAALKEFPKLDALFGNFGTRMPYSKMLAFRDAADYESFPRVGIDCEAGNIVPIQRAGFHFVLMRLSLLERIGRNPFSIPEGSLDGEDWAFCRRACDIGANRAVGTAIPVLHIDPSDGMAYCPGMPALQMDGLNAHSISLEHMASNGTIKQGEKRSYGEDVDRVMRASEMEGSKR